MMDFPHQLSILGVKSYGLSGSSLEEVFIAAAAGGAAIYKLKLISPFELINGVVTNAVYTVGYRGWHSWDISGVYCP